MAYSLNKRLVVHLSRRKREKEQSDRKHTQQELAGSGITRRSRLQHAIEGLDPQMFLFQLFLLMELPPTNRSLDDGNCATIVLYFTNFSS